MECIQGGELFDHIKDYDISGNNITLICNREGGGSHCILGP